MHEHDAARASLDGIAFRHGKREGSIIYFDGREYKSCHQGGVNTADPTDAYGFIDWKANSPKPEVKA